ncbi:3-oxoadipate enol-lactonase [Pandoraea sp. XY-2]|uniref:3-oxoadipate enol-lactonase n=1 Tax=Pandoraea sp. XY-2 TaxID=2518599 RepID=UPI00101AF4F7|nr:3-oxoadipate enol-lactonase [Pandoraea sp. XY-2]QBC32710.1 3-oxoadipate enol-lactonase [Pandoraea sp. XY-2]
MSAILDTARDTPGDTHIETRNGRFRVAISGPASAPVLVLSNSLGTTLEMWDAQVPGLARDFRVVRYDTRGHGGSVVTQGPYTFDQLGDDVVALLDALDVPHASFCGVSMGGHTGLWLGLHAAARFDAIAVCNSAARIGTTDGWTTRATHVRAHGKAAMAELAASSPSRWFTEGFIAREPECVTRAQAGIAALAPEGYASCCDALASSDLRDEISSIKVPTLLIAGEFDPVTTVADAKAMQHAIAGSTVALVPASHLSNIEAPAQFEAALCKFLAKALD